jgi:hypothetical protein
VLSLEDSAGEQDDAGGLWRLRIWVYDVCKGILLAEIVGVAESMEPHGSSGWLANLLPDLCVHAAISDLFRTVA